VTTLVLDEIGELPLNRQAVLLRALQEGEIQPVGGGRVEEVNVRVIACTNRDLEAAAREGRFRQDPFFRIAVVDLEVPPLLCCLAALVPPPGPTWRGPPHNVLAQPTSSSPTARNPGLFFSGLRCSSGAGTRCWPLPSGRTPPRARSPSRSRSAPGTSGCSASPDSETESTAVQPRI
jgi:Sigma-54 interaction domain